MTNTRQAWMSRCPRASHFTGALVAAIVLTGASSALAYENPWEPGTSWLSVRVGYAKLATENAPNGAGGYGFGFNHMMPRFGPFQHFAMGGYVHHEVLGRQGPAVLIDVPLTLELTRQFMWQGQLRPYLGLGYGAYYTKAYRFPDESTIVRGGYYVVTGFNTSVSDHSLIGMDVRGGLVADTDDEFRWSLKLNYAWAY